MSTTALNYPLGRPLVPAMKAVRHRILPAGATPLVSVGDPVRPEQPIADVATAGGNRVAVLAGVGGRVTHIVPGQRITVEGVATVVQGIVGLGAPVVAPLALLPRGEAQAVVPIPRGAIIVHQQQLSLTLLQRAAAGGAVGIIAASATARELEGFARADLSVILDGLTPGMPQFPLTVLLTEGLGLLQMNPAIYAALAQRANSTILLSGATNPRRGIRPEAVLPLPPGTGTLNVPLSSAIEVGARVSISSGQHHGMRGEVVHVFQRQQLAGPQLLTSGAMVKLEDGSTELVPVAALDRIS
jgi:hypothetical protein